MSRALVCVGIVFGLIAGFAAAVSPQQEPSRPIPQAKKDSQETTQEFERELERAIAEAGNDRAALVRNLEDYLRRFPDAPRKQAIFRALVEASIQLQDNERAADYAERLIALQPEDVAMMLLAVELLEKLGDERSLIRAAGYVSRVLDRVEKTDPASKPARVSAEEWESEQKTLRATLHVIRGRVEMARRNYDEAARDLEASYRLAPNAPAAVRLGEISEIRKDYGRAIEFYTAALVLTGSGPSDREGVERVEIRRKLGNVWRMVHGSEAGLGEKILEVFDRVAKEERPPAAGARNATATRLEDFVLRRLDGSEWRLREVQGKVLVLNFWATWCLPCRELEPLFEQVMRSFAERDDAVFFAVNTDEDEARVRPYVERERMRAPVVFADGLDDYLRIRAIPTVVVLDRAGKLVYRGEGFSAASFVEDLRAAIKGALGASQSSTAARLTAYQVVNAMPDFWRFWEKAEKAELDTQIRLFREMVVSAHPEHYSADVLNLNKSIPLDEALEKHLNFFFSGVAGYIETMRRLSEFLSNHLPEYERRFRAVLPDFPYSGTIYFLPSIGSSDAGWRRVAGRPALLFGIEGIARIHGVEANLGVFFHHEMFHVYHDLLQNTGASDAPSSQIYRSLWREGLATYASKQLNLRAAEREIFGRSPDMPPQARAVLSALARGIRENLDSTSRETYGNYFLGNSTRADIPTRSGWYVGYLIAEKLAKNRTLAELARLKGPQLRQEIEQALREIETGH